LITLEKSSDLPAEDMLELPEEVLSALSRKRILITGGTGFVGTWLLHALERSDREHHLAVEVMALSRRPEPFLARNPRLAAWKSLKMLQGDVRDFELPPLTLDLVIHGATSASKVLNEESPLEMIDVIVRGTERVLDLARRGGAKRLLFLSSGLAYGRQPADCLALAEGQMGQLDALDPKAAYGNAKHFAEHLSLQSGLAHGIEVSIARLFAFVGPLLPLDAHFAVGNFLRDGLAGRTIRIQGDGTPLRTYLHAGELAHWIWTLAIKASPGEAYNVGSDEIVSIRELAEKVGSLCGVDVDIAGTPVPGQAPALYVPDVRKAASLGLKPRWDLDESLRRTLAWHRRRLEKEPL
jgi:nucleoside-diphosphate-sugar epimerase